MWWFSETSLIDGHIQREGQTRLREASCVLRVRVMVVHEKRVLIVSLETARNSPWAQPLTSTLFSLTQHLTFRARGKGKQQSSATLFPLKLVGALTVRSKPLLHYPFYCSAFVDSVRGVNSMTLVSFVAQRCVVTVCVWTPTVCEPFQHNNAMSVTPVDFTPYVRHTENGKQSIAQKGQHGYCNEACFTSSSAATCREFYDCQGFSLEYWNVYALQ